MADRLTLAWSLVERGGRRVHRLIHYRYFGELSHAVITLFPHPEPSKSWYSALDMPYRTRRLPPERARRFAVPLRMTTEV